MDKLIHQTLNWLVNRWAIKQNFSFPPKFTWSWKLQMLTDSYEPETTALFKKIIRPGMVIIDIGAHIGYYTRLFARLVGPTGKILAFEPEPDNFRLLQKNTSRFENIKLFNLAISDQNGKISFYKVKNSTGCHSVIPQDQAEIINVNATTIDSFIAREKIKHIDIIKIDIEGGEAKALEGMKNLLKNTQGLKLITEVSSDSLRSANTTLEAFLKQLHSYGFNIFEILERGQVRKLSKDDFIKNISLPAKNAINLLAAK